MASLGCMVSSRKGNISETNNKITNRNAIDIKQKSLKFKENEF